MTFGFSYIGLIWLLMLLIPNFIWTKNQPKDYEKYAARENKILLALERCGEFIVTPLALIFSDFNFKGWNFWFSVLLLSRGVRISSAIPRGRQESIQQAPTE